MTKRDLESLRKIREEIRDGERRIASLERRKRDVGDSKKAIRMLSQMITDQERWNLDLVYRERAITLFISQISDPMIRRIVNLRCVECLPWAAVAVRIGSSQASVEKLYERYLKKNNII